jgi:Fic family protein
LTTLGAKDHSNRADYYHFLSLADNGTDESLLQWSEYVLKGLKAEIEKIDRLMDYNYLKREILVPSIVNAIERKYITDLEARMLRRTVEKQVVQAGDFKDILVGKLSAEISRQIRKLTERKMLVPEKVNSRKYILCFENNYLLRSIIFTLGSKGYLPFRD